MVPVMLSKCNKKEITDAIKIDLGYFIHKMSVYYKLSTISKNYLECTRDTEEIPTVFRQLAILIVHVDTKLSIINNKIS